MSTHASDIPGADLAPSAPSWSERYWGAPHAVVRSALFAAGTGRGRWREDELIAAARGVEITVSGPPLGQPDLDLWLALADLARDAGSGWREVRTSQRALLRAIGRSGGGSDRRWLIDRLRALGRTQIDLRTDQGGEYIAPLVARAALTPAGELVIGLDDQIADLFAPGRWGRLDRQQRQALRRRPLAAWLHAFYSSHRAGDYTYHISTLRDLSGSTTASLRSWRQTLRRALDNLAEATGWRCEITADDRVVVRKPQRRRRQQARDEPPPWVEAPDFG